MPTRRVRVIDGAEVARELERCGCTQRAFAKLIGIHEVQLSRVVNGDRCDPEMGFLIIRGLERLVPVR